MSNQEFVIELEPDATGHRGVIKPDDAEWLKDRARREPGSTRVRLVPDERDTEGHTASGSLAVQVIATTDDDDTEGHAISIHFPTRKDADAFRKRLLVTGVLVGTLAVGAAGGIGLSALQSDDASGAGAAGAVQAPTDTDRDLGIMDASGAGAAGAVQAPTDTDRDLGIMDASGGDASTSGGAEPPDPIVGPR